jgi:hypothetical protein
LIVIRLLLSDLYVTATLRSKALLAAGRLPQQADE